MAIEKSELYSLLWKSCNKLRGGIDASHYKDCVPALSFVKYVSDNHANPPQVMIDGSIGSGFAYTPAGVSS